MELELDKYFKAVLRWWWLILLSTVIAAGVSYYASSQQPPIFQTTTTLMVGQVMQEADPKGSDFSTTEQLAESYAQIAERQPVLQATVESLGLNLSWRQLQAMVNVAPIPQTQLLAITVEDNSPHRAVAIADEIAQQLIQQSPTSPENEARQERSQFVHNELDDLQKKIETARVRVTELEAELETALSARQIQDLQNEITNLESLIRGWQRNYTDLLDFLGGGGSPNFLTVIEPAQLPTVPVSPRVLINVIVAAFTGFILAVAAALLIEYIDDTLKSTDDLSSTLKVNPLGGITRIKSKDYQNILVTVHSPFSPLAEAYRGVRTNLQFMALDQAVTSLLVTSANPGEGKSVTAANLGATMAQAYLKTIVVDADLRQPSVHRIFELPNQTGLSDLIRSPELELEDCLQDTGIENLQVITSGPLPPNPAEILGSARMTELIQRLEASADVVIFDSPPVLAVADAVILASRVDGVVLVVKAKRTRRSVVREALKRLQQVGARLVGGVMNQVPGRQGYYAYYSYSHSGPGQNRPQSTVNPNQPPSRGWWQRVNVFKREPVEPYLAQSSGRKNGL